MKKEEKEEKEEKRNKSYWLKIVAILFFVIFAIVLVIWLTRGSTTTSGEYPDDVMESLLTCKSKNYTYPFFRYDNSMSKETVVKITFDAKGVKNISLNHSLNYADHSGVEASEAHNHASMNISFGEKNLGADALGATYSKFENKMVMNLYSAHKDLTQSSLPYFLIDLTSDHQVPDTAEYMKKSLENKSFTCAVD